MKIQHKFHVLEEKAVAFGRQWTSKNGAHAGRPASHDVHGTVAGEPSNGGGEASHGDRSPEPRETPACVSSGYLAAGYPSDVVDLIIFHKLHLSMPLDAALRNFRSLKSTFVDWNEVRVSSIPEIRAAFVTGPESLPVAVFIKEFLEFLHRLEQKVSLEFLMEQNLGEIRRYFKKFRGIDGSTVNLILRVRKEHPVLPLNRAMEAVLDRLGISRKSDTRERKERALYDRLDPGNALAVHHFLLNHSQEYCPPDEASLACHRCCMRSFCTFYAAASRRRQRGSGKNSRSSPVRVLPGRHGTTKVRARGPDD